MRIIGGSLGGRRLKAPPGTTTRPTSDRVREAIFNILGPPPPGTRVLDGFAGAGALGLEALSRGAAAADFIDSSRVALRCLRHNIQALGVAASCRVHPGDALALLARWSRAAPGTASGAAPGTASGAAPGTASGAAPGTASGAAPGAASGATAAPRFGWVFLDPPYRGDLAAAVLEVLGAGPLLAPDAVIVVEHDRRNPPANAHGSLVRRDRRRYGDTEVSFYTLHDPMTPNDPAAGAPGQGLRDAP